MDTAWADLDAVSDQARARLAAAATEARAIVAEAASDADRIEEAERSAHDRELQERRAKLILLRAATAERSASVQTSLRELAARFRSVAEKPMQGGQA